jgi:hypothetical protein
MSDGTCERCGRNPAVLRLTHIVRGTPVEFRLCKECADAGDLASKRPLRCGRCGKEYAFDEVKLLLEQSPPPAALDEDSFRQWTRSFACWICGEPLFPNDPSPVWDAFRKGYPMSEILRRCRPDQPPHLS